MKKIILILVLLSAVLLPQNPQWIIYNTSNSSIPSNQIHDIIVDNINRKWITFGGVDGGLLKIEYENWTFYDTSNSAMPSNYLTAINTDLNQNFWAGGGSDLTNFRLTRFDGSNWTIWNRENSPIPQDRIMSIIFDNQNDLWLLCMKSLTVSDTNYVVEFTQDSTWIIHTSFITVYGFRQMLFDINQVLWIADFRGLHRYYNGNLTYTCCFPGQYVTDIKLDYLNNIWIAIGQAGWGCLVKYDGVSFTTYPNIQAISIEIDSLNNVWVGTESFSNSAELIKYDGNNWISYNPSNSPLPSTYRITDLAFDKFWNLWIGTVDSGLVVFNENGIVIPVELVSFSSEVINSNVELNWSTATEKNNKGFEILRSVKNDNDWVKIGFVDGHGTTSEPQFYSFTDESLKPGNYQYRLKQIDFDGSFEYSKIIEVAIEAPTEFSLSQNYPNPFNPTTNIEFQIADFGFVTLNVYDVLGNEVATLVNEEKPAGEYEVKFSVGQDSSPDISSGIYFYQLRVSDPETISGQGFVQTKKMVLLK